METAAAAAAEDENFQTTSIDSNAGQWHYYWSDENIIRRQLRHIRRHTSFAIFVNIFFFSITSIIVHKCMYRVRQRYGDNIILRARITAALRFG